MPNWCDTIYICVGDKKETAKLNDMLKEMEREDGISNGFGNMWLGNLVTKLGEDWNKVSCRGEICCFESDSGIVRILQSTAWGEQDGVRKSIEKRFPSIKVYWQEFETGNLVFATNDKNGDYFKNNYIVVEPDESHEFVTLEQVAEHVSKLVGFKVNTDKETIENSLAELTESKHSEYDYFLMAIDRDN